MNKEKPKVLTRMRLSCCWGDNLNEKELNEVVDYINTLQQESKHLKDKIDKIKELIPNISFIIEINGKTQYLRLTDTDYGKELLKILGENNE